jgi:carboxypeptidase Q
MIAMSSTRILRLAAVACFLPLASASAQGLADRYRPVADSIIAAALRDSSAWNRLAEMTDKFGNRISGSESLEHTIDWIIAQMQRDGLQNVRGEPVMVPHWVRGAESAELVSPRRAPLTMLGLGMSVGTPPGGIEAEVMVVSSFDEFTRRSGEARGKIVLFDAPFVGYGQTVRYRTTGASVAARAGAVAVLIRSVAAYSIRSPHTGTLTYDSTAPQIPAAALSVEDAMMLHRMADRGERVAVRLTMGAQMLPDAPSRNVMGEIVGRERPREVVVLGGHIDSWDVGNGAMDDGGGVVVSWEAVRLLKRLGLRPRRTIRVVGWTNEENGSRGGLAYRDAHQAELANHVLAFESDGGVFRPTGFGFAGGDSARAMVREIATLLRGIGADSVTPGGGGADIGPIVQLGVPAMSPNVDGSRYFWFHHSNGDTVDKLDAREMAQCVAAFAVMVYVVADMPDRLPRAPAATR